LKRIYLDHAATSRPKPEEVYRAVDHFLREVGCNPGRGGYELSLEAGRHLLHARHLVADFLHVPQAKRVVFGANTTQCLNLALKGLLRPGDHALITGMEHNAVLRPLTWLKTHREVTYSVIPCSPQGLLDPAGAAQLIGPRTRAIIATHASNVTGTIMPLAELGALARAHGLYLVVDAAQTAGFMPIDFTALQADVLAFPGHKHLLGPMGTGGCCLSARAAGEMEPLIQGGTGSSSDLADQPDFLPDKFESGTPNMPGIAGLAAGITYLTDFGLEAAYRQETLLTAYFLEGLATLKGVVIHGPRDARLQTGTISVTVEGLDMAQLSFRLDSQFGVMTRPGLHCAPLAHRTLGTFPEGTLRFSLGYATTRDDIDYTLEALKTLLKA